jgi:hypothetical protein
MSLSLALGILVSDLSGYRLLTTAHARGGSTVLINDGVATGGVAVRDVVVNGELVAQGVIADSVQIVNSTVEGTNGVIIGGGTVSGVIIGGGTVSGVIIGGGTVVGGEGDEVGVNGAVVNATGTLVGGTLTGDNIVINNGIITGQNLLLGGATIEGGSINGTMESASISPAN